MLSLIHISKRGFNNIFAKPYEIINLSALDKFEDGETVTAEALLAKGILSLSLIHICPAPGV